MILLIGLLINVLIVFFTLLCFQHKRMVHLKSRISDLECKIQILGGTKSDNEYKEKYTKKYERQTIVFNLSIMISEIAIFIIIASIV